jgi:hypothetical protein
VILLGYAFLARAYWAAQEDLDYLLGTSAYRTVTPLALLAGVLVAPLVELLLRDREAPVEMRDTSVPVPDTGSPPRR